MCNPTRKPTDGMVLVRFGTYKIRNSRKGGLEAALWGMSQANMDLGILQETKTTNGVYTRGSAGYKVIATDAPSRHCGGVALFYRPTPHFVVESVDRYGPNVMGFQVATGAQRWYIVGAYVSPKDEVTMETVVAAIERKPPGADLMVAGDFNVDIMEPKGNRRAENIATDLATAGVENMAHHFMPRRRAHRRGHTLPPRTK